MACFSDLPFELQTAIWHLVLPNLGGAFWVELEGLPLSPNTIQRSIARTRIIFDSEELTKDELEEAKQQQHTPYHDYIMQKVREENDSSPFFDIPYAIVPSVWGETGRPVSPESDYSSSREMQDEITETRRCRQLSSYTQVAAVLSTCHVSRLVAKDYISKRNDFLTRPLWRGVGPLCKPRPLRTWEQQYWNLEVAPEGPLGRTCLQAPIDPALDLMVLRLHTALGHPTQSLIHAPYQLVPDNPARTTPVIGWCPFIGIEWRPLWATEQGEPAFCLKAVHSIIGLFNRGVGISELYLLVDGIPRQQWDRYPSVIPAIFRDALSLASSLLLQLDAMEFHMGEAQKSRFRENFNLDQEFEANGRRYYIVFVVADWPEYVKTYGYPSLGQQLYDLNPEAIESKSPFPGGEDLWPEALRDPIRFLKRGETWNALHGSASQIILSWEPI